MKSYRHKQGFTLVEILIVMAIIAMLTSVVIGIARRVGEQDKERLTEDTIAAMTAALREFNDYGYRYAGGYSVFDFPLDCNGFSSEGLKATLQDALGVTGLSDGINPVSSHSTAYSGSEAMYFFLSRVAESRKALDRIDRALVTKEGLNGQYMDITIGGRRYPLVRVIDPWGKALRYDYYVEGVAPDPDSRRTFPVIISAGADGIFGTDDDISSK